MALRSPEAHPPISSLYIHTPFCSHKCHYCDFYSFVDQRDQQPAFLDRLTRELVALAPHAGPIRTIFIGGGTPSLLALPLWERLLNTLHTHFDLAPVLRQSAQSGPRASTPAAEFTVECNPETTTRELCDLLAARGVTRVSVGAQSFNPTHLKTLERWHDPDNVARALEHAAAAGITRRSIDLIFAIPGQSVADWNADLDRALNLNLSHLSCYNLTYEPNTAMTRRLELGAFTPVDDDTEAEMFTLTHHRLAAAGLRRYEVSNFAAPGQESLHNLAYWRQDQWLAAGPSASGHVYAQPDPNAPRAGSFRFKNVPRLGDYLADDGDGTDLSPIVDLETPDPLRLARERVMMGLRLSEGLSAGALLADLDAVSPNAATALLAAAERVRDHGHLVLSAERWTLTDAGFLLADGIAGELMHAIA